MIVPTSKYNPKNLGSISQNEHLSRWSMILISEIHEWIGWAYRKDFLVQFVDYYTWGGFTQHYLWTITQEWSFSITSKEEYPTPFRLNLSDFNTKTDFPLTQKSKKGKRKVKTFILFLNYRITMLYNFLPWSYNHLSILGKRAFFWEGIVKSLVIHTIVIGNMVLSDPSIQPSLSPC